VEHISKYPYIKNLVRSRTQNWIVKGLLIVMCLLSFPGYAQTTVTVDFNQQGRIYSEYIFGKNNSFSGDPNSPLSVADLIRLEDSGITIFRENGGNNSTKYNWNRRVSSHPDWYNNVYSQNWDFKAQSIADHFPDRLGIFGLQLIGKAAKTNEYNFNDWEYNNSQWWEGVHQNLAGGGIINEAGGSEAITDGDPELYLMDWPADSTVGILDHWFGPNRLGLNQDQFRYWCMDNEPSIWNGTHDDISTDEETAEDYFQKYLTVAKAARAKFPNIKLMGPIFANEWQWYIWHDMRIDYKGQYYSSLEYFIKRIGEEQSATGIRLLDVLTLHNYPGNQNVEDVVQFHRMYFDEEYRYPDANGVKTINGGWDESINKEYIFKRALDWMEEHVGLDHGIGLGVTETGVAISDQNGVAVWYASTLGEFMKNNVEVFTPWSWQPAMWEVVNIFTEYSYEMYYDAVSTNEELVSAYTTADKTKEYVTSILVNRSSHNTQEVQLNVEGTYVDTENVKAVQLSGLDNEETFKSDDDNALVVAIVNANSRSISVSLPPLSVAAVTFKTTEEVVTGFNSQIDQKSFRIFPNPIRDGIVQIKYNNMDPRYLRLTSLDGKEILSISTPSNEINVCDIESGMYILQLTSTKGTFVDRLVIQH
jgi:hypothetical protein